jgi:hypothetical protein
MMVRFRDINDPSSVEQVDAASIGIKRIHLENTRDPVTTGIGKRFGWFDRYLNRHFDGTSSSIEDMTAISLAAHMSSRSFFTEIRK